MTCNLSWVVPGVAFIIAGSVAAQQPPEVRRVVTKIDSSGKAVVMFDGAVQLKSFRSPNPAGEMWVTDKGRTGSPEKRHDLSHGGFCAAFARGGKENGHQPDDESRRRPRARERASAAASDDAPHAQP